MRYINTVINDYTQGLLDQRLRRMGFTDVKTPVTIEQHVFYNENLTGR